MICVHNIIVIDPAVVLRHLGFRVRRPSVREGFELIARRGEREYAVEARVLRSVRADEVMGTLADAFVRLRHDGTVAGLVPLILLIAPRWTPNMVRRIFDYRERYLGDCGVVVAELGGAVHATVGDLRVVHEAPRRRRLPSEGSAAGDLFSDLGQWLLKVLVKQAWRLADGYVTGPAARFVTDRSLASAADVSINRAWTVRRLLAREGFLDDHLVRIDDLLEQWRGAVRWAPRRISGRWAIATDRPMERLKEQLADRATWTDRVSWTRHPRACLAGHAAAWGLGHGFVAGAPPEVYVERFDDELIGSLDATRVERGTPPDFVLVVPKYPESVFRACVPGVYGTPTADVIQTWLDLADRPDRGAEQADVLRRKVLHAPR